MKSNCRICQASAGTVDMGATRQSSRHAKYSIDVALPLRAKIFSAASAAVVAAIVTTPLDVLKTRLQVANLFIGRTKRERERRGN